MAKITLRGKQEETLLWALDIAINSYLSGDKKQDKEDEEFRLPIERLRNSLEKQLGYIANSGEGSKELY